VLAEIGSPKNIAMAMLRSNGKEQVQVAGIPKKELVND